MTPSDFRAAVARTRLRERGAEAARLVLVDGLPEREAGRRVGVSGSVARRSRMAVERAWLEARGLGPPLVVVTVACSPERVEAVREAARERQAPDPGDLDPDAILSVSRRAAALRADG